MRILSLPKYDQPRIKLRTKGAHYLTDAELLAIIIGTGTKNRNALRVASEILRHIPINQFHEKSVQQLQKISGLGEAKLASILACIELARRINQQKPVSPLLSPKDIFSSLSAIRGQKKEHFIAFYLDVRNQCIQQEIISIGTLNASLVHPREVFEPAVRLLAAQIILAHNHPSGAAEPSQEDIALTKRMQSVGIILGIHIIDHVIVTSNSWYSFKEHTLV